MPRQIQNIYRHMLHQQPGGWQQISAGCQCTVDHYDGKLFALKPEKFGTLRVTNQAMHLVLRNVCDLAFEPAGWKP